MTSVPLKEFIEQLNEEEPGLVEKLEESGLSLFRRYGPNAKLGPNVPGLRRFLLDRSKQVDDFQLIALKRPGSEKVIPGFEEEDRPRVMEWLRCRAERDRVVEKGKFDTNGDRMLYSDGDERLDNHAVTLNQFINQLQEDDPELIEELEETGLSLLRKYGEHGTVGPNVVGLRSFLLERSEEYDDFELRAVKKPDSERIKPGIRRESVQLVKKWLESRAKRGDIEEIGYYDPESGEVRIDEEDGGQKPYADEETG